MKFCAWIIWSSNRISNLLSKLYKRHWDLILSTTERRWRVTDLIHHIDLIQKVMPLNVFNTHGIQFFRARCYQFFRVDVTTRVAQLFSDENGCKAACMGCLRERKPCPKIGYILWSFWDCRNRNDLKITWEEVACELRLIECSVVGVILRRNKRMNTRTSKFATC